jgi:hypothetical protein
MLYMTITKWEPDKRDAIIKRVLEKGTMRAPGTKVIGDWVAIEGGRMFSLTEGPDDPKVAMQEVLGWSDILKMEMVPVIDREELMKILPKK